MMLKGEPSVIFEAVESHVVGGRFAIMRVAGEKVTVIADI